MGISTSCSIGCLKAWGRVQGKGWLAVEMPLLSSRMDQRLLSSVCSSTQCGVMCLSSSSLDIAAWGDVCARLSGRQVFLVVGLSCLGVTQHASIWMLVSSTQPPEGPWKQVVWMKCLLLRALIDDISALWVHLCRCSLPALAPVPISCVSSWSRAALAGHQHNLPKACTW